MDKGYRKLNLGGGYQQNTDTEVLGGVVEAVDVDLKSKPGTVRARKKDETDVLTPGGAYSTVIDLVVKRKFGTEDNTYAILTKSVPGNDVPISGFLTRGFRDVNGDEVAGDEGRSNWKLSHSPRTSGINDGNLEHNGKEIRLHCDDPQWFGIPPGIDEETIDFKYVAGAITDPPVVTEPTEDMFKISEPFCESNTILAPSPQHLEVFKGGRMGQDYAPGNLAPMFGDVNNEVTGGVKPRFQFLYFAASYMYDGWQESPLGLLNMIEIRGQDADWASGAADGWCSIYVDMKLKSVVYGLSGESVAQRNIPKRVRKIRLYCFPSRVRVSDPLAVGTWYIANEIDVAEWDSKNKAVRWSLPCKQFDYEDDDGALISRGVRVSVDIAWVPESGPLYEQEPYVNYYSWPNFLAGRPWFTVGDDETKFPIVSTVIWNDRTASNVNSREVALVTHPYHADALDDIMDRLGNNAFVRVFHCFDLSEYGDGSPFHRTYIGDELMKRPTYAQLCGFAQGETFCSPPRRRGYVGYDVPIIYRITDKDGVEHDNRLAWPRRSPAGVQMADIFNITDWRDSPFSIMRAVRSGPYLALIGDVGIEFGILRQDDLAWDFSDSVMGIGTVSEHSVAETPYGTAFLSQDGVRMLTGNRVSDVISLPVRDIVNGVRSSWSTASGCYSSRWNWYILQFNVQLNARTSFALVFDFDVKQWTKLYLDGKVAYCAVTDPDGDALFAVSGAVDGQTPRQLSKVAASETDYESGAAYSIEEIFDDPIYHKRLQNIKLNFESYAIGLPLKLYISTDTTDDKPADAQGNEQAIIPESGVATTRRAMTGRKFTFRFTNFQEINTSHSYIEGVERS